MNVPAQNWCDITDKCRPPQSTRWIPSDGNVCLIYQCIPKRMHIKCCFFYKNNFPCTLWYKQKCSIHLFPFRFYSIQTQLVTLILAKNWRKQPRGSTLRLFANSRMNCMTMVWWATCSINACFWKKKREEFGEKYTHFKKQWLRSCGKWRGFLSYRP